MKLIGTICSKDSHYLLLDRAYEDDKPRALATKQGAIVLLKKKRRELWDYDKELYKCHNEVERYFLS